jgi:N-sulfoglucosamine sulfohydrolase
VKGQIHEDAFHIPLAIRWPAGTKPGSVVEDFGDMTMNSPSSNSTRSRD